ncbi:MAG: carbamoyltransferase HypF [Nitrospirae bacterium]|nr:carbamoyltransferase HypF [Nitrospirota bacterium]MCL5238575.1 carbamoyltransferase HypF [Nitrospirota bacterium]
MSGLRISVKGVVQGVGFRPFVYSLAKKFGLKGSVKNTSDGVVIEAEGDTLDGFIEALQTDYPPLARIDSVDIRELPSCGRKDFIIIDSVDSGSFTLVSPDISICNDCLKELFDPSGRRYLYPFINCTNCGPRYSITKRVPYDRPNTTMSEFTMCSRCSEEYHNPEDRRFHAQPNACSECGPHVSLRVAHSPVRDNKGIRHEVRDEPTGGEAIRRTIELLRKGALVAVKGLGGFHLCCDAANETAVRRLRERKRRNNKPFALMSPDVETIRRFCEVSEDERRALNDMRRPVVLLGKRADTALPFEIAPNNKYLGFMLPYTPLHYLLFHYPLTHHSSPITHHCFSALVMTSGNLSEEPIVVDNEDAFIRLSAVADAFLLHNRDIFMRVDDSVVKKGVNKLRVTSNELKSKDNYPPLFFVRRSRGFAPESIRLEDDGPDVLGCGADIKNTFTITRGPYAIMSQHIGDMENLETLNFFEEALGNLKQVYRSNPLALAYDLHPAYLSSRWALDLSRKTGIGSYGIQHHYAHAASVMAEKGIKDRVIGITFDGAGYGTDGNLWGGEFLVCDLQGFIRAAHFKYIPLPGGASAVKECWRTAISYIADSVKEDKIRGYFDSTGFTEKYGRDKIGSILKILDAGQFSPLTSGAGRLFDAVAALTGICDKNTFEGEAAIALESIIPRSSCPEVFPVRISDGEPFIVDFSPMILAMLESMENQVDKGLIAARFHNTLAEVITEVAGRISRKYGIKRIVLSGGVFQNMYLLENSLHRLLSSGFEVHTNENVPCNDAGVSLGQAYILRERLKTL